MHKRRSDPEEELELTQRFEAIMAQMRWVLSRLAFRCAAPFRPRPPVSTRVAVPTLAPVCCKGPVAAGARCARAHFGGCWAAEAILPTDVSTPAA